MRGLILAVVVAALAWSAYWLFGARRAEQAAADWFAAAARAGWTAAHGEIRTAGFPNRLDTTIYRPRLADPDTGLGWDAPFVQVFRLTYKPGHAIVIFPESQRISFSVGSLDVLTERMRASVVLEDGPLSNLLRSNLVAEDLSFTGDVRGRLATLLLAVRQSGAADNAYDIGVDLRALRLDPDPLERSGSPSHAMELRLDYTVELDAPVTVAAGPPARPLLRRFRLRELELVRGTVRLRAEGVLDIDAAGGVFGSLDLSISDWASLLRLAQATGMVSANLAQAISDAFSGRPGTVTTTMQFGGGRITLGGADLGPSPRLPLR